MRPITEPSGRIKAVTGVSTESGSDRVSATRRSRSPKRYPVATAPGTDSIIVVEQSTRRIPSGTQRAAVQACNLRENEHDLKDREKFEWREDDDTTDWPHAAGAPRRIESANKGRRGERHAGLERSQCRRPGCHSLPRSMLNRRHLPRPLFPLYIQLDRQRAVQGSIKFAEHSTKL